MHWDVFAISAAHLYQIYLETSTTPVRLVKEWILILLKKTINLKTVYILALNTITLTPTPNKSVSHDIAENDDEHHYGSAWNESLAQMA
jgi:hypothetical protein